MIGVWFVRFVAVAESAGRGKATAIRVEWVAVSIKIVLKSVGAIRYKVLHDLSSYEWSLHIAQHVSTG